MKEITTKIVKCGECNKFFGWTETDPKCRFCHAVYGEVEKETEEEEVVSVEEKPNDLPVQTGKKGTTKTKKETFKIWRDN